MGTKIEAGEIKACLLDEFEKEGGLPPGVEAVVMGEKDFRAMLKRENPEAFRRYMERKKRQC